MVEYALYNITNSILQTVYKYRIYNTKCKIIIKYNNMYIDTTLSKL